MSFKDELAPHLPYLRRYARALTGSQVSGDSYVRAALEAILSDPSLFDRSLTADVALFRVFHVIWSSSGGRMDGAAGGSQTPMTPEDRLSRLAPSNRQALLLTAMEGFAPEEAAAILGTTTEDVDRQIVEAQSEIERELATEVLIIEDESLIALDVEAIVRELGHGVVGVAATRNDAVALARKHRPGLVLADIQLADNSSGIDAVKDILGDFDVPVIFITAYPERLLTGARPEPTYLVTKPFQAETVKAAIGQALFFHPRRRQAA